MVVTQENNVFSGFVSICPFPSPVDVEKYRKSRRSKGQCVFSFDFLRDMIILRTKGTGKHIFKQTEQITRIALLNQRSLENARDALSKCSNLMMHTLRSSKCSNATLKLWFIYLFWINYFVTIHLFQRKQLKNTIFPFFLFTCTALTFIHGGKLFLSLNTNCFQ